ncbi:hypothetical protein ELY21_00900 [Legionella sp. km535]|uniref:hypothetical protein n=1 Tax=Legionella sp. km535 TaxID=2498107 RepID=UPI000F8D277F|nr:hypothetical protein [Legionella sp. km535]RUR20675.1 hypothetical protein ELY21_00900 [Legionella sp. km535]
MSRTEIYNGRIIRSNPLVPHIGGFSSNGVIEIHTNNFVDVSQPDSLQARIFNGEDDADIFYIEGAIQLIDQGLA